MRAKVSVSCLEISLPHGAVRGRGDPLCSLNPLCVKDQVGVGVQHRNPSISTSAPGLTGVEPTPSA